MNQFDPKRIFGFLKLSKEAQADLDRIMSLPEVKTILDREESGDLAFRSKKIHRLEVMDSEYEKRLPPHVQAAEKAMSDIEKGEAALREAKLALNTAQNAIRFIESQRGRERRQIRDELAAGRDPRLDDFYRYTDTLKGHAGNLLQVVPFVEIVSYGAGRPLRFESNIDEVRAATSALSGALDELEGMVYQAISKDACTKALSAMTIKLQPILEPLGLNPPFLNEHGEVQDPFTLTGTENVLQRIKSASATV